MADLPLFKNGAGFPVTHWTLVETIQGGSPEDASEAMAGLCRSYWYPIYAFLRREGRSRQDAEDLTQEFFHRLITEDAVSGASREHGGRLRSWLLAVLKRLLSDHSRQGNTQKRGGSVGHVSFEALQADERYTDEPCDCRDPELLYSRLWAQELLDGVRESLRSAYAATGREKNFALLLPFLMWDNEPPSYGEISAKLGISEGGTRILVHRLRVKFRSLLQAEIARTVLTPEDVPNELAWLQSVLAS